jgi:hypothetical protein
MAGKLFLLCSIRRKQQQILRLARLASLFINFYLSSIIDWLFIFITKYINTDILCYLYIGFSYSNNLAYILSENLYNREQRFFLKTFFLIENIL